MSCAAQACAQCLQPFWLCTCQWRAIQERPQLALALDLNDLEAIAEQALAACNGATWRWGGEVRHVCFQSPDGHEMYPQLEGPQTDAIVRWALAFQPQESLRLIRRIRELERELAAVTRAR